MRLDGTTHTKEHMQLSVHQSYSIAGKGEEKNDEAGRHPGRPHLIQRVPHGAMAHVAESDAVLLDLVSAHQRERLLCGGHLGTACTACAASSGDNVSSSANGMPGLHRAWMMYGMMLEHW